MLDLDEFQVMLSRECQDRLSMVSLWLRDHRVVSSLNTCNRAEDHYIALPVASFYLLFCQDVSSSAPLRLSSASVFGWSKINILQELVNAELREHWTASSRMSFSLIEV
jgi:hypothetical protein